MKTNNSNIPQLNTASFSRGCRAFCGKGGNDNLADYQMENKSLCNIPCNFFFYLKSFEAVSISSYHFKF